MGEKQKEMDTIQAQYDVELAQLKELQDRFVDLELEYNTIMAQRKRDVSTVPLVDSCIFFKTSLSLARGQAKGGRGDASYGQGCTSSASNLASLQGQEGA